MPDPPSLESQEGEREFPPPILLQWLRHHHADDDECSVCGEPMDDHAEIQLR